MWDGEKINSLWRRGGGSSYSQKPKAKLTNSDCKLALPPNPVFFSCSFCAFKIFPGSFLFAVHDVIRIAMGVSTTLGLAWAAGQRGERERGAVLEVRSGRGAAAAEPADCGGWLDPDSSWMEDMSGEERIL